MINTIVDTAISMATIYLTLSLLCAALQEWLAQLFKLRSGHLERSMTEPLGRDLARRVLRHGVMTGLSLRGEGPSYIPSDRFVAAIKDLYASGETDGGRVREGLARIPDQAFRKTTEALLDAVDDRVGAFKVKLADWFDQSMETAAAAYKRRVQTHLMGLAAAVTLGLNIDAVSLVAYVYAEDTARIALVTLGTQQVAEGASHAPTDTLLSHVRAAVPIGWSDARIDAMTASWAAFGSTLVGWLISILALTLGAPFWFDLLKTVINIRSDGLKTVRAGRRFGRPGG